MWLTIVILTAGVPQGVSEAITAFDDGYLYLRTIGMESQEPDFPRDSATGLQICTDGCEPEGTDLDIELWNTTMLRLWGEVNTAETRFTVTAGNEALYYENFLLFFADSNGRTGIVIHPEELWSILHHLCNCTSPATGQIMVEGYYPEMSPAALSATVDQPVMRTIQTLLKRGRDSLESG